MTNNDIKQQAIFPAKKNKEAEPDITRVFWLPNNREVRLVELHSNVPSSETTGPSPFYFRADPDRDLPAPSGVILIRPEEYEKVQLPDDWGTWDDAEEVGIDS